MKKHFQDVDIKEIRKESIDKGKRGVKQVVFGLDQYYTALLSAAAFRFDPWTACAF